MKPKIPSCLHKSARIFLVLTFGLIAQTVLRADWIDVKDEGVMNGDVLNEGADTVTFRESDGTTHQFPRAQVLYIEKSKTKAPPALATKESAKPGKKFSLDWFLPNSRLSSDSPKPMDFFTKGELMRLLQKKDATDKERLALAVLTEMTIEQMAAHYFYYDIDVKAVIRNAQDATAKRMKKFQSGDITTGAVGLALMGIGLLAILCFGFGMLFKAFEQGFVWGMIYLSFGIRYASAMIGGPAGLFLYVVPMLLNIIFIVRYWQEVRKLLVYQLLSVNIFLAGCFLLMVVS